MEQRALLSSPPSGDLKKDVRPALDVPSGHHHHDAVVVRVVVRLFPAQEAAAAAAATAEGRGHQASGVQSKL